MMELPKRHRDVATSGPFAGSRPSRAEQPRARRPGPPGGSQSRARRRPPPGQPGPPHPMTDPRRTNLSWRAAALAISARRARPRATLARQRRRRGSWPGGGAVARPEPQPTWMGTGVSVCSPQVQWRVQTARSAQQQEGGANPLEYSAYPIRLATIRSSFISAFGQRAHSIHTSAFAYYSSAFAAYGTQERPHLHLASARTPKRSGRYVVTAGPRPADRRKMSRGRPAHTIHVANAERASGSSLFPTWHSDHQSTVYKLVHKYPLMPPTSLLHVHMHVHDISLCYY
jgi:hypothetical protein